MPFVSKSQARACFAKKDPDWNCEEWAEKTDFSKLPEKKKGKEKKGASTLLPPLRKSIGGLLRTSNAPAPLQASVALARPSQAAEVQARPARADAESVWAKLRQVTGEVPPPTKTASLSPLALGFLVRAIEKGAAPEEIVKAARHAAEVFPELADELSSLYRKPHIVKRAYGPWDLGKYVPSSSPPKTSWSQRPSVQAVLYDRGARPAHLDANDERIMPFLRDPKARAQLSFEEIGRRQQQWENELRRTLRGMPPEWQPQIQISPDLAHAPNAWMRQRQLTDLQKQREIPRAGLASPWEVAALQADRGLTAAGNVLLLPLHALAALPSGQKGEQAAWDILKGSLKDLADPFVSYWGGPVSRVDLARRVQNSAIPPDAYSKMFSVLGPKAAPVAGDIAQIVSSTLGGGAALGTAMRPLSGVLSAASKMPYLGRALDYAAVGIPVVAGGANVYHALTMSPEDALKQFGLSSKYLDLAKQTTPPRTSPVQGLVPGAESTGSKALGEASGVVDDLVQSLGLSPLKQMKGAIGQTLAPLAANAVTQTLDQTLQKAGIDADVRKLILRKFQGARGESRRLSEWLSTLRVVEEATEQGRPLDPQLLSALPRLGFTPEEAQIVADEFKRRGAFGGPLAFTPVRDLFRNLGADKWFAQFSPIQQWALLFGFGSLLIGLLSALAGSSTGTALGLGGGLLLGGAGLLGKNLPFVQSIPDATDYYGLPQNAQQ